MLINCKSIYKFFFWVWSPSKIFKQMSVYSSCKTRIWVWNDRILCASLKIFGFNIHSAPLYPLLDSKSTSKFSLPGIWEAVIQIWNYCQKPHIWWALLFNAWFLHVPILFITATAVVLSENVLICLPCISNLTDFKV